jgi:hypothetical protein
MAVFFDKVNFSRIPPLKGKAWDRPSGGEEDKCPRRRARALFKKIRAFCGLVAAVGGGNFPGNRTKTAFPSEGTREKLHMPSVTGLLAK